MLENVIRRIFIKTTDIEANLERINMKRKKTFNIGEVSRLFNVSADSIRYYEKIGFWNQPEIRKTTTEYILYRISGNLQ